MAKVLDRERPDVVHLHNIYHQLSPSILKPIVARGIPVVMTLHDYKLICPTYQLLDDGKICEACLPRKFREAAKRRCNNGSLAGSALSALELTIHTATGAYGGIDVFICPSHFMQTKMTQGRVYPDRLVHLPNFCDLDQIDAAQEPGRGVLYAGRLAPEKGVDTLIAAAAHLPIDVTVTIAGDGPSREDLEKQAAELGVTDRVRFLGRVPGEEVQRLMRASAVVAVPSRWHENQPMTILEAFGCGRPVVATNLGGLPELVGEETGRLVPPDAPAALAAALLGFVSDPAAAHTRGQAARQSAEHSHSMSVHLAGLDAIYDHATARHTGGTR